LKLHNGKEKGKRILRKILKMACACENFSVYFSINSEKFPCLS
jgi:hypothetical protein